MSRSLAWFFAVTTFLSALLVFQVQPIISKCILPWFGGGPAVWTTCLVFFQVVLFFGYSYAHASIRWLPPRGQGGLHALLIVAALAALPITPSEAWKPQDAHHPEWRILLLLAAHVGVPYFVLSSTGPLLQAWLARMLPELRPYRLYALSNVGSLVALVSYPFLVEPRWAVTRQGQCWSVGFCLFGLLMGYVAWRIGLDRSTSIRAGIIAAGSEPPPTRGRRLYWLALAALPSLLLLATTNHVCQDVAVVPFLWIVPLALYLVSFIICFENEHWYSPRWCGPLTALAVVATCVPLSMPMHLPLVVEVSIFFTALFLVCLLAHGELVRLKPSAEHLTSFYLSTSAGGALGGVLVALIAPSLFRSYAELSLGLIAAYLLSFVALGRGLALREMRTGGKPVLIGAAAFVGLLVVVHTQASLVGSGGVAVERDFYGVVSVNDLDEGGSSERRRILRYGRIMHGAQYLEPARRGEPTVYYRRDSGVGRALGFLQSRHHAIRVGVVGLGVGTLAAYGRPGDLFRFYEINPTVERLAREHFTFLSDTSAQIDVVLGDARVALEREPDQRFDLLVLDAFSGDAIPTHLLTREAFTVYERHLAPGGAIAVHITNRHVNLDPVVLGAGLEFEMFPCFILQNQVVAGGQGEMSRWALMARYDGSLPWSSLQDEVDGSTPRDVVLWTDERSHLLDLLK